MYLIWARKVLHVHKPRTSIPPYLRNSSLKFLLLLRWKFFKNSSLKFLLKFSIARRSCTSFSRRLETSLSQILAAKFFTSALESLVLENFAEHSCLWNQGCGFRLSQLLSELGSHQSLRLDMSNCLMDKSSGAINLRSCGALV